MRSYFFESITEPRNYFNWGVFVVLVPDDIEWAWQSHVKPSLDPVLGEWGWTPEHVMVLDLQTGEAAMFRPGSDQKDWLDEHRILVSPQFKPFLAWLAVQDIEHLYQAPGVIELPDATFALRGWREIGPHPVTLTLHEGDLIRLQWAGKIHPVICESVGPEGAVIRSLSRAEALLLMGGPEEDAEQGEDEDEPGELDYEEMREGLPPPWRAEDAEDAEAVARAAIPAGVITAGSIITPPDLAEGTVIIPDADAGTAAAASGRRQRKGKSVVSPNVTVLPGGDEPTEIIPAAAAELPTAVIPAITDGAPGDNAGSASPS